MRKYISYIVLFKLLLLLTSCGASQSITQRQLLIQKEIDMLQAEYYYQIDSLYIEYYKD